MHTQTLAQPSSESERLLIEQVIANARRDFLAVVPHLRRACHVRWNTGRGIRLLFRPLMSGRNALRMLSNDEEITVVLFLAQFLCTAVA